MKYQMGLHSSIEAETAKKKKANPRYVRDARENEGATTLQSVDEHQECNHCSDTVAKLLCLHSKLKK